jgi:hypothetical protein
MALWPSAPLAGECAALSAPLRPLSAQHEAPTLQLSRLRTPVARRAMVAHEGRRPENGRQRTYLRRLRVLPHELAAGPRRAGCYPQGAAPAPPAWALPVPTKRERERERERRRSNMQHDAHV